MSEQNEKATYLAIRLLMQSIQLLLINNGRPIIYTILCKAHPLFHYTQVQIQEN
jgi:hypothetical protein